MDLKVLGCHGGESPRHRTTSFLVDDRVAIDAGAITSTLTLEEQRRISAVLVSHAHLDHVRDLATLADNRCQAGGPTLQICGAAPTLDALRAHFFNDVLWPDFSKIPAGRGRTISYVPLAPGKPATVSRLRVTPVPVSHTIDTMGFLVSDGRTALGYSGDTGPTDELWRVLSREKRLKALLMEVSFPNDEARLARVSGHHTPKTMAADLRKLRGHEELPVLLYHIKPSAQARVERELARIRGRNLTVLRLGDHFVF